MLFVDRSFEDSSFVLRDFSADLNFLISFSVDLISSSINCRDWSFIGASVVESSTSCSMFDSKRNFSCRDKMMSDSAGESGSCSSSVVNASIALCSLFRRACCCLRLSLPREMFCWSFCLPDAICVVISNNSSSNLTKLSTALSVFSRFDKRFHSLLSAVRGYLSPAAFHQTRRF